MKKLLFCFVYVVLFIAVISQESALCRSEADAEKLLKEGADLCNRAKYKEAIQVSEKGLKLSRELKNKKLEARFLNSIGYIYYSQKDYPQSLKYVKDSLKISREIGDKRGEGDSLGHIGEMHGRLGEYQKALMYYQDSLKIFREIGDKSWEGKSLFNIGNLYKSLGEYQKAMTYYQDSLKISREIGDKIVEASSSGNIGTVYANFGEHQKALTFYQDSLKISQQIGDKSSEGIYLNNIGNIYEILCEYQKALSYYQNSLKIFREIGDKSWEGKSLLNIGNMYLYLHEYQKALSYYQDSLKISREIGDKYCECNSLNNIAIVYNNLSEDHKALTYFQDSLKISQLIGDKSCEGKSLLGIGNMYMNLGEYQKALTFYQDSLKFIRKIGNKRDEGFSLNGIGTVYYCLGEYHQALAYYQDSLKIRREICDKNGEGMSLNNIGILYKSLGEYQKALMFYQDSLKIIREIGDKSGEGASLNNIGILYIDLGEYKKALPYFQHYLQVSREIVDKRGEGISLGNMGKVYNRLGENEKALTYFQESLKIYREISDKRGEGESLHNIGNVYDSLGDHQKALTYYQDSLKICREIGDKSGEGSSYRNIGWVYIILNQNDKAIENLKQSIEITESIRKELKVEEHKISFLQDKIIDYELLIYLLIEKSRYEEAWNYLERSKARTCLDMLGNQRIDFREKAAPELIRKEKDLDDRIMALKGDLNKEGSLQKKKHILAQLEPLQNEYEQVIEKMKLLCPEYASLRSVQVSSLREIQSRLDDHTLILEYFICKVESAIFLIDNETIRAVPVPHGEKAIREMIEDLERRIATKAPCDEQIKTLSQALLNPAKDAVKGKEKLIIVPDSTLYYLPFSMLKDGEGDYLVKNHQILTQPSASVWKMCLDKTVNKGENLAAYAIGDYTAAYLDGTSDDVSLISTKGLTRSDIGPLPATRDEVESISALYPGGSVLIGKNATSGKVKETIKSGNLVHFATHAVLDAKHPLFSGLVLSDRLLTTAEIFSLETEARLVVLSACKTAGGGLSNGDELVGISRAFMYAGSPVVVASLWKVSDTSTARLMSYFYEALKKGEPAGEAMRNAQLRLMKDYPHPYYWAPFVVMGDSQGNLIAGMHGNNNSKSLFCIVIIVLLILPVIAVMVVSTRFIPGRTI